MGVALSSSHRVKVAASSEARVASALSNLGHRLAIARKARELTQEDLASAAGVGLSTLRKVEAGAQGVAVGNVLRILQALGLLAQVDELLDPQRDAAVTAFAVAELEKR